MKEKKIVRTRRAPPVRRDHRVEVAERKRKIMRARLLDATMRVHAEFSDRTPVIEDVVHEAGVSRGTFYKHFASLDEALGAVGHELNDQMTTDILPVYDILKEPWQRFSVGFRVFLVRAVLDRKWAGFVTRMEAWPHDSLVAKYMSQDLNNGKQRGQFSFGDLDCTTDLLMGASSGGIQALRRGVPDPAGYIDSAVSTGLRSLGCSQERCAEGVKFSSKYLQQWMSGHLPAGVPKWAKPADADHGSAREVSVRKSRPGAARKSTLSD
jgi:AcrR family transcriptional regulator